MLDLDDIKKMVDKAYSSHQTTRERAADDLVFYWITHWDDAILDETQLLYRGEFDVLRKAGRGILADLASNPVQVDFEPKDENRDDAAEILDGLYRKDNQNNVSIEAFSNADSETVVCGFGGWELYHDYVTTRGGDTKQVIKRRPIYEANNTLFFDPNAKLLDKSDASYACILYSYTEDGYKDLVEELTGERPETLSMSSFKSPQQSYTFPWALGDPMKIYVGCFYHREKVKKKVVTIVDPFGIESVVSDDELKEKEDEYIDSGFEIVSEKDVESWQVTKYICSGNDILDTYVVAGEHIPVVPEYGERAYVEDEEHYEGVTRLAKDPQRLRDFIMSYLADMASRSPRDKPIFDPRQVKGYEDMYEVSGSENNYPYVLANTITENGEQLPVGPIGTLTAPQIPQSVGALLQLTRQAVEDVANPGVPQDIADTDLSGKAVMALQARLDMQSLVFQNNRKHARRRDGEIYASMASEIYDVPREVKITLPDGQMKTEKIMETVWDEKTNSFTTIKDLRNVEFDVYSRISADYKSQKEQTLDRLTNMLGQMQPGDPLRNVIMLKTLILMDGVEFDEVRDYARNQLIIMGIKPPETPEEQQILLQQQQQGNQPSAEMVLAMAEQLKGQADMLREKREVVKMELEYRDREKKHQIEAFNAQTKRFDTEVAAQKAGADIDKTQAEALGKKLDNQEKVIQLRFPEPGQMTDDDLISELMSGNAAL